MRVRIWVQDKKDQDIERLKRGGCYEREKQGNEGKQEGATEKPQGEEKDEEGEEDQVGWTGGTIEGTFFIRLRGRPRLRAETIQRAGTGSARG